MLGLPAIVALEHWHDELLGAVEALNETDVFCFQFGMLLKGKLFDCRRRMKGGVLSPNDTRMKSAVYRPNDTPPPTKHACSTARHGIIGTAVSISINPRDQKAANWRLAGHGQPAKREASSGGIPRPEQMHVQRKPTSQV